YIKSSLSTKDLQVNKLFGIADKCVADTPEAGVAVPVRPFVLDNDGFGEYIEYNDTTNLTVYHRVISNQYLDDQAVTGGDKKSKLCITEMIMIVCANRKRLQLSSCKLEAIISSDFPQSLPETLRKQLHLSKCSLILTGSVLESNSGFRW
ncbi:MAG: hypothetical protein QM791_23795, partial [Ferruginibacter sp.]